ncbi:hypothetical protein T440DRAFT_512144 [Plenodomus tracheiphilus IPT5]|uniref:Uncharacterized protein n=1 Tax=Plenodomus tracheiphilus IPT5 TaxID=1408161 RepID=A0A6A7AQZ0_9PLEO|nr:hypothetical protein T440DRAFT_512144 [Plenodomus tracheiphilus IPT5]
MCEGKTYCKAWEREARKVYQWILDVGSVEITEEAVLSFEGKALDRVGALCRERTRGSIRSTHRLSQMLQKVLGVGRVNKSVDTKYVATYRAAEDIERRIWGGTAMGRSQAADAGNEETTSTCNALYSHVHARARWSFFLRLGSLVLHKDDF